MEALEVPTRIQLKNILYATDFSAAAEVAALYAAELAKHYGAKLHALHVRPVIVDPMSSPENWRLIEKAAEMEAERERRKLLDKFAGIETNILIGEGDFWPALRGAVQENDIDLIIVGTRGRSGIRKFLLGSVAEEVVRNATCPVLTVGPYSPSAPKAGGEINKILFATDFSPESSAAVPYAISLAQEFQAHLTLLHVITKPKTGDLVHPSELAASSLHLLRKLVPWEAELWCAPEYIVEQGAAAERILEVAARQENDLIVLGVRKPAGLTGAATHLPTATAHKVVSRAYCPVLTVRA